MWSDCWELVWVHLINFSEGKALPALFFHFLAVILRSLSFCKNFFRCTNYGKEMLQKAHPLNSEPSLGFVFICKAGNHGHSIRGPGTDCHWAGTEFGTSDGKQGAAVGTLRLWGATHLSLP